MLTLEKAQEIVQQAKDAYEASTNDSVLVVNTTKEAEEGLFTLSEVARYLKTSETRIRHWEKSFTPVLSNNRNQLNHRVFTNSDIKILEKVKFLQDTGFYTKQGIVAKIKSGAGTKEDRGFTSGNSQADKEYKQKLMLALNTLAVEIKSLRREVREDLQAGLRGEIEHLTMLLFPPQEVKKSWWDKLWSK
jgi:DNA-binding transcriptional MerR regulator